MNQNDEIVRPAGLPLGAGLQRYVTRHLAMPAVVALLGLGAAYLTRSLLEWSDLLVNRGLGAGDVAALAVYQLVPVVSQVLPFAALVGVLAGLGHLRSTGELRAVEVLGVSPRRLTGPALWLAGSLAVLGVVLSVWLAPAARAGRSEAFLQMLADQPGASLSAGVVHEFGDHRLTAREVSSRGDALRGVVLWSPELGETLFAERASVTPDADGGISLLLHHATALLGPSEGGGQIEVDSFRTALSLGDDGGIELEDSLTAAAPAELLRIRREAEPADARLASAELHRRVALPLAGVILAILAVPLALAGSGGSRTSGAMLGLVLTLAYYGLVQLGTGLLRNPDIPVPLAVWLPNLLFASIGTVALLRSTDRTPGRGIAWRPVRLSGPSLPSVAFGRFLLARYVATIFVQMVLVCLGALFIGYLLVDVLERLDWFARHQSTAVEAARFYAARSPLLMSRMIPLSLLAAAALTVSQLERRGEFLAMQACGLSAFRSLVPIAAVALVIGPAYFLFADGVVPRTNALADHLKETEIKRGANEPSDSRFVWYRGGGNLLQADRMDRGLGLATDVTIYELDDRGFPSSRIDAREARDLGNGEWELLDPHRVEISGFGVIEAPAETRIRMGESISSLDPMHLGVRDLAREIRRAREDGYSTTVFEVDMHARLAAPFACILLPWIAIASSITGRVRRTASRNLMLAVILAVGFELFGDFALSLGYGERVSPAMAAWAPMTLLGLLAVGSAWRSSR
ncbi:MAG: LptF/LptG family permease [Deltaproteobacteria bacterium]|nr:LptF/LptG family permease [Deltaproteobacteria bacterium]MBW2446796.1 LptF/LptG family permease [Deltaproteobacteria bacterium]